MIWGAPSGTDDTYYKRLLDGGLPTFRTFNNCIAAVKAYADYWTFAARYRSPFEDAPTTPLARGQEGAQAPRRAEAGRSALGVGLEAAPAGVRHQDQQGRAVHECRRGGEGGQGDRLPGRDEGVVARPAAQERRRARARRRVVAEGRARRVRRAARQGEDGRQEGAHRRRARVRDGERRRRDAHRRLARRALRTGRHRRDRRHLHRGVRRRDVPRPAVRRRRSAPHAARAPGLQAARRRARREAGRRRRARRPRS